MSDGGSTLGTFPVASMPAQILDGNRLAKERRVNLGALVAQWRAAGHRAPGLGVILVGNDPASEVYVAGKRRDCEEVGVYSRALNLDASISQSELEDHIFSLNDDPLIDGILVQTPLPEHIDEDRIIDVILPDKDVDGFHAYNIGRLALRRPTLRSCTPMGIMQMLDYVGVPYKGQHATIIGASNHVGRPMGLELLLAGCTVTTAHKFTRNTGDLARQADILISAVGKPGLVPGDWVKPGAVVIDVGITRDANNKLRGDLDFVTASERAAWITPVPGGVGPMTRVALLQNTLQAAAAKLGLSATLP
jgi:methylenetetrahydrofolate dehydrogenase (NADP+)/methenyltetrahydrofolate cyclohydrolase